MDVILSRNTPSDEAGTIHIAVILLVAWLLGFVGI
jgi:hypothetical protein